MELKIDRNAKTGEVTLEGDPDFFFWLTSAAGNARNGRPGNICAATEGKGSIRLQPTNPIADAPSAAKKSIAEVAIEHAKQKAKPTK